VLWRFSWCENVPWLGMKFMFMMSILHFSDLILKFFLIPSRFGSASWRKRKVFRANNLYQFKKIEGKTHFPHPENRKNHFMHSRKSRVSRFSTFFFVACQWKFSSRMGKRKVVAWTVEKNWKLFFMCVSFSWTAVIWNLQVEQLK
jgi:hypothetical protein